MPPISQGGIDHAPNFSGSARSFAETLAVLNARVMIGKSGIIFGGTTSYARPRYLRSEPDLPDEFYQIYVVDASYQVLGTLPLDKFLRARRATSIEALMNGDPPRPPRSRR